MALSLPLNRRSLTEQLAKLAAVLARVQNVVLHEDIFNPAPTTRV